MIVEARRDVITLRGILSENEWPTIQTAAKLLLEEHPRGIIIDCSQLTEITEEGAKTFLDGIGYIQKQDAKIIVAGLPTNALGVVRKIRSVVSQLPIAPTIEDARTSLGLEDLAAAPVNRNAHIGLVLLIGDWQRATEIACKLADRRKDQIHVVDILKVPRTMPLATPLPEAEAMTRRKLDDADVIAKHYKFKLFKHVERARTLGEGIQKIFAAVKPEILIVCMARVSDDTAELVNQVMPNMLANPPCEVIYISRPDARGPA
ncbi:MAG: hypothetical protein ABFD46_06185 [Armatimonadota bacterium]